MLNGINNFIKKEISLILNHENNPDKAEKEMSTPVIINGYQNARIFGLVEVDDVNATPTAWVVIDDDQILFKTTHRKWAEAALPAIQSGD